MTDRHHTDFGRELLSQKRQTNVTEGAQDAAAAARARGAGIVGRTGARISAGSKAYALGKWKQMTVSTKVGERTSLGAKLLRLGGYDAFANFLDFMWTESKPDEGTQGRKEPTIDGKTAEEKSTKQKKAKISGEFIKKIDLMSGTLIRIDNNVGLLASVVSSVSDDVSQIKQMLAPKDFTSRDDEGKIQFGQFNPLAPAGAQFLMYEKKKLDTGEVERGKLTGKPVENIQDAIQQAAIQTAILSRKMEREDEAKAELKRKRDEYLKRYNDPEEKRKQKNNPCECLKKEMEKYSKLFDALQGDKEQEVKGGLSWIERIAIFFGTFGKYLMPFLRFMVKLVGRMTPIAFAAWIGWEIGKIIGPHVREWVAKGWNNLKEWWEEKGLDKAWDNVKNWGAQLKATLKETFDDMILRFMPNSDWAQEIRDNRARTLSDEDLVRVKELSQRSDADLWANVDMINDQLANPNISKEDRANYMRIKEMYQQAAEMRHRDRGGVYPIDRGGLETKETISDVIRAAAKSTQADYATLMAMAKQESGFDPNAATNKPGQTASGLFGMTNETYNTLAARYGDRFGILKRADKNDPNANALAAALLMREHENAFREAGINPNPRNLYAAHMLGIGGAKKLINSDTSILAKDLFDKEWVNNNREIFFKDKGRGEARTVGELQEHYGTIMDPAVSHYRRIDGGALEGESIDVATAHRGGKGQNTITAPVVVNRPIERAAPPVAVRMPTTPSVTQDGSLLGAAARDAHPSLA